MKRTPYYTFLTIAFAVAVSLLHLQSAPAQAQIDTTGAILCPNRPTAWESLLWSRLPNPTLRQTISSGIDTGVMRQNQVGVWEIWRGALWERFDPAHVGHVGEMRKYYRYCLASGAAGWSAGPGCHNRHHEPQGQYAQVHGRPADPITHEDLDYDCALYKSTKSAWCAKFLGGPCPDSLPGNSSLVVNPSSVSIHTMLPGEYASTVDVTPNQSNAAWNMRLTATGLPKGLTITAAIPGTDRIGITGPGKVEITVVLDGSVSTDGADTYFATLRINHTGGPTHVPINIYVGQIPPSPLPPPLPPDPEPEPAPIPIPPCERIEITCSDVEADPSLLRTSDGVLVPCRAKLIPCT